MPLIMKSTAPPRRQKIRGVTMIEILIAIIVFSAGLLGLLSAASLSIRTNAEAYQFTQVTNIADYLIAAMQRNSFGTLARSYNGASFTAVDMLSAPNYARGCLTVNCSSATLAQDDIAQAQLLMGRFLPPGAVASIQCQPQFIFLNVAPFLQATQPPNTGDCLLRIQWTTDRVGTVETRSWSFQP